MSYEKLAEAIVYGKPQAGKPANMPEWVWRAQQKRLPAQDKTGHIKR